MAPLSWRPSMVLFTRPKHTLSALCSNPPYPSPAGCLGPQLTPSPCPHPPRPSHPVVWHVRVCLLFSIPLPWADPASFGSPRHSRMPHTIGTKSGAPSQTEPVAKAGVRWRGWSTVYFSSREG